MSDSEEQVLKETSEEVENMEEELLPAGPTISGLISLLQGYALSLSLSLSRIRVQ